MDKKGGILNQVIIQIILIGLVFAFFLIAVSGKDDGRGVARQVLERELALLVDSGVSGMSFEIQKTNMNGVVSDVRVEDGKIFVDVNGLVSLSGYSYFSKYNVGVSDEMGKFVVTIK